MTTAVNIADRLLEIRERVDELTSRANSMYDLNIPRVHIIANLRGLAAGTASWRKLSDSFTMHLHGGMVQDDRYLNIMVEVIPHEMAHLVRYAQDGSNGRGHGPKWKEICIQLGGSGLQ